MSKKGEKGDTSFGKALLWVEQYLEFLMRFVWQSG